MAYLHTFPTRAEAYLDVWEVDSAELQFSEWKYHGRRLPEPAWTRNYCVCLENEQKLFIFQSYKESLNYPSAKHIPTSILGRQHTERPIPAPSTLACLPHAISAHIFRSERSSTPCLQSLEHQQPGHHRRTGLDVKMKVRSSHLSDGISTPLPEFNHTLHSPSKSAGTKRFNRRLRARTFAALPNNVMSLCSQDYTMPFNGSFSSLADQSTPNDASLTGEAVCTSLTTLDGSFGVEVPETLALDDLKRQLASQRIRRTPSRLQRLLQGLRRSFSSQHVGSNEPTQSQTQNIRKRTSNSEVPSSSDRIHTDGQRRPKSYTRLSRLLLCVTPGDVNHMSKHSDFFFLENEDNPNTDQIDEPQSGLFSPCFDGSHPSCPTLGHSLSGSLIAADIPSDSGHTTKSSMTPLFPVGDSFRSVSFTGTEHQQFVPRNAGSLAQLDLPLGYLLTFPGLVHFGALHPTLTGGRPFCFFCSAPTTSVKLLDCQRLSTDATLVSRIFAAPSLLSRLRWLRSLRRTAKPNLENERHRENSLKLSILEARNLSSKRRYYCDICLDRTLYARTTSKTAIDGIFWAEDFDLNNLPNVSVMTISLYKEADSSNKDSRRYGTARLGSKKYRKSQNQLIGFVTIPMSEISGRNDTQAWLNLQPPTETGHRDPSTAMMIPVFSAHQDGSSGAAAANGLSRCGSSSLLLPISHSSATQLNQLSTDQRDLPQLRIRARYQSVEILPIRNYGALKQVILDRSLELTTWLESVLPVKAKEEVASSLIGLHECNGTLVEFLTSLVQRDVANLENESMAFRSNTMATKAVECFVKMAGSTYLHNLLYRLVQKVLGCMTAWEVNPEKLSSSAIASGSLTVGDTATFAKTGAIDCPLPGGRPLPGSLMSNQLLLLHHLSAVWRAIQSSLPQFPSSLMRVFCSFRATLEPTRGAEFCDNLISACIFLRLICPALLSPSLFGLVSAFPSEPSCQRNLTLLAKSLQSLANFSAFDDKEPYMRFLNGFVSSQMSAMRTFIRNISTWPTLPGRPDDPDTVNGFRDVIDEAFELANLHLLLSDLLKPCNGDTFKTSDNLNLPDELSQLPQLLDDLSTKLYETLTSAAHSLTNLHGKPSAFQLATERLHKTLPCRTAKSSENHLSTSDFGSLSTSQLSTENQTTDYAFHSLHGSSPLPYYTLHQNPGFHNPKEQRTLPVHILSPPAPSAPDDDRSLSAGQCVATRYNANDYDEPYNSPQPGSDDESYNANVDRNGHEDSPPPPPVPDRLTKLCSSSQTDDLRASALPLARSVPMGLDATRVVDEEPIYDLVPSSDASSTDDLVLTNEKYLYDSTGNQKLTSPSYKTTASVLTKSKQGTPLLVQNGSTVNSVRTDADEPQSRADEAGLYYLDVAAVNGTNTKLNQSPRIRSKQVTKANVVLTLNNSGPPPVSLQYIPTKPSSETGLSGSSSQADSPVVPHPRDQCNYFAQNGLNSPRPPNGTSSVVCRPLPTPATRLLDETTYDEIVGDVPNSSANNQTDIPEQLRQSTLEVNGASGTKELNDGLEHEVVRLRHQLELSRADAARAANRLSQQEAELAHLRQLLIQLRAQPQLNCFPATSSNQINLRATVREIRSQSNELLPGNILENVGLDSTTGKGLGTCFSELDDAMARLEKEQAELQQEQARIRARMGASRHVQPTASVKQSSLLSSVARPRLLDNPISYAKPSTVSPTELRSLPQVQSYVHPTQPVRYGPRVRHDPPPQPRNGTSSRRDPF